ncbi:MAG: cyclic nucleotide-binding domain-containing protein [Verrucomicrobia bacterium]|nr:cyclic nucleotide-binding domain-containing protein [Verrucomicrobiota bacterium]
MTESRPIERFAVLCVDDETADLAALVRDLETICGDALEVDGVGDPRELLERAEELANEGVRIALVVVDHNMPGMSGTDLLIALHEDSRWRSTHKILLSGKTTVDDLNRALNRGALNGNLPKPWTYEQLRDAVRLLITEYFVDHAPQSVSQLADIVDVGQLARAFAASSQRQITMQADLDRLKRGFIQELGLTDQQVEAAMIGELDRTLSNPERLRLPAGTVLLREGQIVDGVWIVLSGNVQLLREAAGRALISHEQTVGPIVGLMALFSGHSAFFTCKAVSEIEVMRLSIQELDEALQKSPNLSQLFVTVLLRSLVRRNRRAVELQTEVDKLNRTMAIERDQLAMAVRELKQAQARLVESEKMATLGQLSAGVAHELNNPVAAIRRAADFLLQDIDKLADQHPDREMLRSRMQGALNAKPVSTRKQRAQSAALAEHLKDDRLAKRLVKMGIADPGEFELLLGSAPEKTQAEILDSIECYYQLGSSLKNIRACAERIAALVNSLRSYARGDREMDSEVDLHQGIEDTLLLFGKSLQEVEILREYGDIPMIECRSGEINQIWTNLISNAVQAMDGKGRIEIYTDQPDAEHVRVRIIDSGPGIAKDHLERVFDIKFTTKEGRIEFGLGLGLAICRQIANRHGGSILADSEPGRTCFTLELPVSQENQSDQKGGAES